MRPLLTALLLLTLLPAFAQGSHKPEPVKVTTKKCSAYTLQFRENGFEDPEDRVSIMQGQRVLATVKDESVGVNFCQDITGDGVPEALLYGFSGGAHCCFTHYLYSLQTPPRLLLEYGSAHSETLTPRQLDGQGPKELVGDDWRFAYAYGLSFAESIPLPVIFQYERGRYVDRSRRFPGVLRQFLITRYDEYPGGEYLANYALLTVVGKPGEAQAFIDRLPQPYRAWLSSYALEIRQDMLSYGMSDWPTLAGLPAGTPHIGIGGSFEGRGERNYLAVTQEGGAAVLRLYTPREDVVQRSDPILSAPLPPQKSQYDYPLENTPLLPLATVWRAGNRYDDALIQDSRTGTARITAYRMINGKLTPLQNDALSAAAALLGDLKAVAGSVAAQYAEGLTPAQKQQRQQAAQAAVQKAAPWLKKTNLQVPLSRLGNFAFSAAELTSDQPERAQLQLPLSYGLTDQKQKDEYVLGERYTLTIDLAKQAGQWAVTNWILEKRAGELNR